VRFRSRYIKDNKAHAGRRSYKGCENALEHLQLKAHELEETIRFLAKELVDVSYK